MAQIPDVSAVRAPPRARLSIVGDNSGQILGAAVARAGDELGQVVAQKKAAADQFGYAQAKSTLLEADIAARRSLENDPDWASYETKYRDAMQKAQDTASKYVSNPGDRALLGEESKLSIERGALDVHSQSKAKEGDWGRADIGTRLDALREAALNAPDQATRVDIQKNVGELLSGAQKRGYIDQEAAGKVARNWTEDFAQAWIVMQDPQKRVEMLKNGKGTPVEFLHSDVRAKLLDQAERETHEVVLRGKAQAATDDIMAKYQDRGEALKAARAIKDPEVQDQTVSRVNQRFAEVDAIDNQQRADNLRKASALVEEHRDVGAVPADVWINLTAGERSALETRSRQVREGVEPVQDWEKWYTLSQKPLDEYAKVDLMALYRPYLDDTHFNQAVGRQQAIKDAQAGGKNGAEHLDQSMSDQARIEDAFIGSKLFQKKPTANSSAAEQSRWAYLESQVTQQIEQTSAAKGGKLTPAEKQKIVDDFAMKRVFISGWLWGGTERQATELKPEDISRAYVPFESIPVQKRLQMQNLAKSNGKSVSRTQIERSYALALLGQYEAAQIELLGPQ